jgi:hypothetical protein
LAETKPYLIVNLVLAALCGLVFLYSVIFSAGKDNHPLPSFYEEITGKPAPSSGMSRAFSEIVRGNFESARKYNPDSVRIFAFFAVQGIQRLVVSLLLIRIGRQGNQPGNRTARNTGGSRKPRRTAGIHLRTLLYLDAATSGVLFLWCFMGQIGAMTGLLVQ